MRQSIRGYTDGVIEQAAADGDLAKTTAELAAVDDLIAGSQDLRQTLADPGVPMASRRAVVTDLLASRVGTFALRLITFAVSADKAAEVVADVGWLATRVGAAAHELNLVGEAVLGHKAAEERVEGYATAVLEVLPADGGLNEVEDELFRFMRIVGGSEDLRTTFSSREVSAEARKRLVEDLLTSRSTPTTLRLAAYATQVGRPRDYENLLAYLVERVSLEGNRRLADVRTAIAMDDRQRQDLADALRMIVGHDVQLRVAVDPSILGGFVATIGDTVVDGSARHRLDLLKERLVMPEAQMTTGGPS